ncbi:cysteine rich repeat-containing protein [Mesorhizobium sp. M0028]|uniref:cysteine rich repeat-containing protein n=1 Tax=unclassified Mesorhizobium TaxID=325217 RepID=UPI00333653C9
MRFGLGVLFLATQLAATAALAQTAAEREACQADYQKLCKGVLPGGGRAVKCLAGHMSELTPECKKVVKANKPG